MKALSILVLSLLPIAIAASVASAAPFKKDAAQVTNDEWNAIAILSRETQAAYFDESAVEKVAFEIALIKSKFPEVKELSDFGATPEMYTTALINLQAPVLASMLPKIDALANLPQPVTSYQSGQVDVSSLFTSLKDYSNIQAVTSVESLEASYSVSPQSPFRVLFFIAKLKQPVVIGALAKSLMPFHEFRYIEANGMIGDGNRITRKETATGAVEYVFSIGAGDCPAGCTEWNNFRFSYTPATGEVVKTGVDQAWPK